MTACHCVLSCVCVCVCLNVVCVHEYTTGYVFVCKHEYIYDNFVNVYLHRHTKWGGEAWGLQPPPPPPQKNKKTKKNQIQVAIFGAK